MNENTAFCPQCGKVTTFVSDRNHKRCSECGTMYWVAERRYYSEPRHSELGEFFVGLAKVVLIMAALALVFLAVVFAGCAVLLHGAAF